MIENNDQDSEDIINLMELNTDITINIKQNLNLKKAIEEISPLITNPFWKNDCYLKLNSRTILEREKESKKKNIKTIKINMKMKKMESIRL